MAKILVIDDDASIREGFQLALDTVGHEVDTAFSGGDGLAMTEKNSYQVVIVDLNLPDMSGTLVIRALKKADPGIKILAVTGADFSGAQVDPLYAAGGQGADEVLRKPASFPMLTAAIERLAEK